MKKMKKSDKVQNLKKITNALVEEALEKIRSGRQNSLRSKEQYFRTAEYFLSETKEYIDAACETLKIEKYDASLALSRWILEASMNLWWVSTDSSQSEQRIADLAGEALRCEAILLDGLAERWPNDASVYRNTAREAKKMRKNLNARKLTSLDTRMKSIKPLQRANCPDIYVLYRMCCAAAHPSLKIWERYRKVGTTIVSMKPKDKTNTAHWMVAASVLYLVATAYCLTKLGNKNYLEKWWSDKIVPLL
ncbi:MAG: hypothetical protein WC374_04940 [Phycisphaerae bacterium]|jgi:hypothetical protein